MFDIAFARQNGNNEVVVLTQEVMTMETVALPANRLFAGQKMLTQKALLISLGNSLSVSMFIQGNNWSSDKEDKGRLSTICLFATSLGYSFSQEEEKNKLALDGVGTYLDSLFPEVEGEGETNVVSITHTPSNKPIEYIFF